MCLLHFCTFSVMLKFCELNSPLGRSNDDEVVPFFRLFAFYLISKIRLLVECALLVVPAERVLANFRDVVIA